jgi:uncharacterized repeat protein (TIGR03803 family)
MKNKTLFFLIGLCLLTLPVLAQTNLLHEFAGGADDGKDPWGDLVISGTTLYGMTQLGGDSDNGVIFKVQIDGSGFTLLHEFLGGAEDGASPLGSLVVSGTTLYGMTQNGGSNDRGTIFKIQTDGSGFTLLHAFAGDASEGVGPNGSLIIQGSTLFGMTNAGGMGGVEGSWGGTIFKIQIDGSDFTMLHSFDSYQHPYGALTLEGSTLYGMTQLGGSNDYGTIFKIQTDGSDYTQLYQFALSDGTNPSGSLILSGTTLYGMTALGGSGTYGTIFKIGTDGTGFSRLHEFAGGADGGLRPYGSLVISGSTLYSMTFFGGNENLGTIFGIETDGTQFSLLHKFAGGADDGAYPNGSLIISGTNFYGMTRSGGDSDVGVVFSLPLPSSIAVISPNGGETWASGESHDITWTTTGMVDSVNIDYSTDDGGNWISVAAGTENDGSYSWNVPNTPSATCLVRVSNMAAPTVADSSDASFAISSSFVAVTSPNGGEAWQRGTTQTITWSSAGVANIKIQLLKGTVLYSTITPSTPATDGSYSWIIPASQPVAANYKVRIISTASSAVADSSDANFAIFVPGITVTAPAAGTSWPRGVLRTITWTTTGTMDGNVKIQLYRGTAKKLDIILSTENDGSYDWLIPPTLAKGTYTIRITTLDNEVKGKSAAFSITKGVGVPGFLPDDEMH